MSAIIDQINIDPTGLIVFGLLLLIAASMAVAATQIGIDCYDKQGTEAAKLTSNYGYLSYIRTTASIGIGLCVGAIGIGAFKMVKNRQKVTPEGDAGSGETRTLKETVENPPLPSSLPS